MVVNDTQDLLERQKRVQLTLYKKPLIVLRQDGRRDT